MSVEGVSIQEKKPEPPKEAPKPEATTQTQSPSPSTTKFKIYPKVKPAGHSKEVLEEFLNVN